MSSLVGQTVGHYQIVEELGRGGMAVVYKAWQSSLGRYVALKLLPEYFQHDPEFLARFHREAKAAASLNHPNIVHVHDTGEADGMHFIVMEYMSGGSLRDLMTAGRIDAPTAQAILAQVAAGLDHAHGRGLIHRDIKPGNILIAEDGQAKVTDFGIAKAGDTTRLTRTGMILGTPEYMAPEQAEGASVDHRVDLYALGVVLYQMLTGKAPFRGTTPHATLHAVIYDPPISPRQINPGISQAVESVLLKSLAKSPEDRFQSGRALVNAFRQAMKGTAVRVPVGARQAKPRSSRRMPVWLLSGAIALVVLVLVGLIGWALAGSIGGGDGATPTVLVSSGENETATAIAETGVVATRDAILATEAAIESTAKAMDPASATGTAEALDRDRMTATAESGEDATQTAIAAETRIDQAVKQTADALATELAWHKTQTAEALPSQTLPPAPTATSVPSSTPLPSPTPPPQPSATPVPTPVPPTSTPQPNVQHIAFNSERDGNREIYRMSADGSGQTRLTSHGAYDGDPALSPNGNRIAFASERDGNKEIYIMNSDGSGLVNISRSPANDSWPAWTPDGQRIAFESDRTGNWDIWSMNADGSGQVQLTNSPEKDIQPSWSPNGQLIVFSSLRDGNHEIYIMNANGSAQTRLPGSAKGEFTPSWSPAGGRIAFMSRRDGNREIYVMNVDGSGQTRLTYQDGHDYQPVWSPNGSQISFTSQRTGNLEIHTMNADGSGVVRLTNQQAEDSKSSWSR